MRRELPTAFAILLAAPVAAQTPLVGAVPYSAIGQPGGPAAYGSGGGGGGAVASVAGKTGTITAAQIAAALGLAPGAYANIAASGSGLTITLGDGSTQTYTPSATTGPTGSGTAFTLASASSLLPNPILSLDAALPASTTALTTTPGIQLDISGHVLNMIEPVANTAITHGFGETQYVTGGPGGFPFFHSTTASFNNGYDAFVVPAASGLPMFGPVCAGWDAFFVMRQNGSTATALMEGLSATGGSGTNVTIQGGGASDGALYVQQNNGHAIGSEPSTSLTALNQWQIVEVHAECPTTTAAGGTISIVRNGTLTFKTPAGTLGGYNVAPATFEYLNNGQADVSLIEQGLGVGSQAQRNAETARLSARYGITVATVSDGPTTAVPPVPVDLLADFMTTPVFPTTDAEPVVAGSTPGDGITLASAATPYFNMTFGSGGTIPDETTLRQHVYMNYLVGNQTVVTGNPQDTGQGSSIFAAVARHYPLGSPHSTTQVLSDGLHETAFCSQNHTACGIGQVYAGFIRLTNPIRPGMLIKMRYKAALGAHSWNPFWLFSGEQKTPGPGGNPFATGLLQNPQSNHEFEIDMNDNYPRFDTGAPPVGSQLVYGTPNIYGVGWNTGEGPQNTYNATNSTYVFHPNAGPPYEAIPGLNWGNTFHDLEINLRGDGSNLIDILIDGVWVWQSYIDWSKDSTYVNSSGTTIPLGLNLMVGNQAVPETFNSPAGVVDNDGITDGWTTVISEISAWNCGTTAGGCIANLSSLQATPVTPTVVP